MRSESPVARGAPLRGRRSADLEVLFGQCFGARWHTRLDGGGSEPQYLPGADAGPHRLIYRENFFASALHETAHWCIAGARRRRQVDFGYWYLPDGRDAAAQQAFEAVEARPQALEWVFSVAAGHPFRPSADNLTGAGGDGVAFAQAVAGALHRYLENGLPPRAALFADALGAAYGTGDWRRPERYGLVQELL
ncbi:MAG: elongation factor P hydroxylase [Porticoccaceae bacterium]